MTPDFDIRQFKQTDSNQVIGLWEAAFGYPTPHNAPSLALQKKLDFQPDLLLVAVAGEEVIGTVMGGYDGHRGWIYSLAVKSDRRRAGVGAALMLRVESELKALGCLKINLQILEHNAEVVAFYEKLGFQSEPRISMGKIL